MAAEVARTGFACRFGPRNRNVLMLSSASLFGSFEMAGYHPTRHGQRAVDGTSAHDAACSDWADTTTNHRAAEWRVSDCHGWRRRNDSKRFQATHRPLSSFVSHILYPDERPSLASSRLWHVCLGGAFAALRSHILRWSLASWRRLSDALARADNLEEGHYAERLWGALLGPALTEPSTDAILCAARERARLGMLATCSCRSALCGSVMGAAATGWTCPTGRCPVRWKSTALISVLGSPPAG
eukprot:4660406-Prymnesium_polylepis.1